jgi:hypothetical protein
LWRDLKTLLQMTFSPSYKIRPRCMNQCCSCGSGKLRRMHDTAQLGSCSHPYRPNRAHMYTVPWIHAWIFSLLFFGTLEAWRRGE